MQHVFVWFSFQFLPSTQMLQNVKFIKTLLKIKQIKMFCSFDSTEESHLNLIYPIPSDIRFPHSYLYA